MRRPGKTWRAGLFLVCSGFLVLSGCRDEGKDDVPNGTSVKGNTSIPTLDVRGGETDSEQATGFRSVLEGSGGAGGSIRLTTSAGDIEVTDETLATAAQATFIVGTGVDVEPGETLRLSGSFVLDFLRVQAGGTIELLDDTFFVVLGDVEIAGVIQRDGGRGRIDGPDLTIDSDGVVNVTGTIRCDGLDGIDRFAANEPRSGGGHGGEIFISSAETTAFSPGPHIFVSGDITSDGGDTFARLPEKARPGHGGQILLGTLGTMTVTGRISARGGFSHNQGTLVDAAAPGGEIQLIAAGDPAETPSGIEIGSVREFNANGGSATGNAGDGGTILFEATVGTVSLQDFDIECRGGDMNFLAAALAGDGGSATVSADVVEIENVIINASGGDALGDEQPSNDGVETGGSVGGQGGAGGTVQIAGVSAIVVEASVSILAEGGDSDDATFPAGGGGQFTIINLDETDLTVMEFLGSVSVQGGRDDLGSFGAEGTVCARGADAASAIVLTGANNFPISVCGAGNLEDLVVHDLDCDDGTINPESVTTELPAITGIDFFRVRVTGADSVTISTSGEDGGNLSLFAGTEAVLGSTTTTDYCFSSTEADSDEEIEIDLTALPGACDPLGDFISVYVVENNNFVEDYTITVSCTFP